MQPWRGGFAGRFEEQSIVSGALEGNPLGDPVTRHLWVYLPPSYGEDAARRYPTIYIIQGLTGQVDAWWNRSAFRPNVPELIDRLFAADDVPPAIVVLVDAFTALGGSQYVNSPGTGRYLDYLCDEVVSFVDARYSTLRAPEHRALTGKSSGGYGAMTVPMRRPDVFGAFASHAGDALFELCFMPDIAASVRALRECYDGSFENFWADFRSRPAFSKRTDANLQNIYCMAACYSAEDDGSVTLPFDERTGKLREEVWQRWLANDPVRMAAEHAEALRSMRAIYIDAGRNDDYHLDVGARAFSAELDALGIDHFFELFDGTHSGIEYRYPIALRYLSERVSPDAVIR
jgi:S-formylglutathione hydrolase FrmB